ncbi:MAG: AAA family ATPase [Candidatus Hodarchaeales archaeon]
MIESIEINNFKSIKTARLDIRPVTILIGPNGSGKSNIIQSLMLLKQSCNSEDLIIKGRYRDFISIEDISFFRDLNQKFKFLIRGIKEFPSSSEDNRQKPDLLNYSINASFEKGNIEQHVIKVDFDLYKKPYSFLLESHKEFKIHLSDKSYARLRNIGIIKGVIHIDFINDYRNNEIKLLKDNFESRLQSIEDDLENIFFIPVLRGIVTPSTSLTDSVSKEFFSSETIFEQSRKLLGTLAYTPEIAETISDWTFRITGVPIKSRVIPSKQATVQSTGKIPINITNEGFGLNQLIFLLTQLHLTPKKSIVTIEEPESHLHPKAQVELVNVILDIVKKKNLKTIITTHNEHILFAFLTHVAKKTIKNEDIAIYYFEKTEQGSKITKIDVAPEGSVDGGLPGFFEANMVAYKSYIDAISHN